MMNLENIKLITLSNGSKWLELAETIYNNENYKYLLGVNDTEDDVTDDIKFVHEYSVDGKTFIDEIKDSNILKIIVPLLVPETKEFIDDPEKAQELIAEN